MENKSNLKRVVVILLIIIVGLVGYIVYDKVFSKTETCPKCSECEDMCEIPSSNT